MAKTHLIGLLICVSLKFWVTILSGDKLNSGLNSGCVFFKWILRWFYSQYQLIRDKLSNKTSYLSKEICRCEFDNRF